MSATIYKKSHERWNFSFHFCKFLLERYAGKTNDQDSVGKTKDQEAIGDKDDQNSRLDLYFEIVDFFVNLPKGKYEMIKDGYEQWESRDAEKGDRASRTSYIMDKDVKMGLERKFKEREEKTRVPLKKIIETLSEREVKWTEASKKLFMLSGITPIQN